MNWIQGNNIFRPNLTVKRSFFGSKTYVPLVHLLPPHRYIPVRIAFYPRARSDSYLYNDVAFYGSMRIEKK
jgi:hypothetical protein